jgi:hypothetical protein
MSLLANSIIQAIFENDTLKMRNKIKTAKVLNKVDFKLLVEILKTKAIEMLSFEDLTIREYILIGKGLMASKIENLEETVNFIIEKESKRTPILLYSILNKNCKFNTERLEKYLNKMIEGEIHLIHLKILSVISKNYPNLMNGKVLEFIEKNDHSLSKEIINRLNH